MLIMARAKKERIALYHPEGECSYIIQDLKEAAEATNLEPHVYLHAAVAYTHITNNTTGLIIVSDKELKPAWRPAGFNLARLITGAEGLDVPVARVKTAARSFEGNSLDDMLLQARDEFISNASNMMCHMVLRGHHVKYFPKPFDSGVIVRPVVLHDDQISSSHEMIETGVEAKRIVLQA